jgi:DNA-binding transcriptional LysR family regulator
MDLLTQMATFVRVIETGSLSAAARAQRLSLPAVSRQLQALELELGTTLLARSTRRLRVTEAGRAFHVRCVRILAEVEEARKSVGPSRVRGRLTVSASFTLGMHWLVPRLPGLLQRHPDLQIDVRLDDALTDLIVEGVDLSIRAGLPPPENTRLLARPIWQFHRVAVAAPDYLRARPDIARPEDLAAHEAIVQLGPDGPLQTWSLERAGELRSVEVRGRLRLSAPSAIRDSARAALGIAWLPEWIVGESLRERSLRSVLDGWRSPATGAWAIYRREARRSPSLLAVLRSFAADGG